MDSPCHRCPLCRDFLCRRHAHRNGLAEVGRVRAHQGGDPHQQLDLRVVPVSSSPSSLSWPPRPSTPGQIQAGSTDRKVSCADLAVKIRDGTTLGRASLWIGVAPPSKSQNWSSNLARCLTLPSKTGPERCTVQSESEERRPHQMYTHFLTSRADGGTSCGRVADFYRSRGSAHAASHHTNCRPTISSVSVQTVDVPVPQVMTQEVFSQVPVPVTTR